MSKHTEGPWDYVSAEHTAGWGVCVGDGNDLILRMVGRKPKAEKQANARLIAAAPDLLDALRELTIAAEAAGWDVDADNAPILKAARAALAKATGDEE